MLEPDGRPVGDLLPHVHGEGVVEVRDAGRVDVGERLDHADEAAEGLPGRALGVVELGQADLVDLELDGLLPLKDAAVHGEVREDLLDGVEDALLEVGHADLGLDLVDVEVGVALGDVVEEGLTQRQEDPFQVALGRLVAEEAPDQREGAVLGVNTHDHEDLFELGEVGRRLEGAVHNPCGEAEEGLEPGVGDEGDGVLLLSGADVVVEQQELFALVVVALEVGDLQGLGELLLEVGEVLGQAGQLQE